MYLILYLTKPDTLGCMLDEVFVDILVNFDADKLWGKLGMN